MNPFDLAEAPLGEPGEIAAGSFTVWRRELDISNVGFTLGYVFQGPTPFSVTGSLYEHGMWSFTIPSATVLVAGDYAWRLILTRTSDNEKIVMSEGFVHVFTSTDDRRSHARIMLAKIESLLEGRADSDIAAYTIKGRQIEKMSMTDLVMWRDVYRAELGIESGKSASSMVVRFG
jgi:hypothetical protein